MDEQERREKQTLYESVMSEEDLQGFRDRANAETKRQEEKPHVERLLENYMTILEDAYYQRTTSSTGVREE